MTDTLGKSFGRNRLRILPVVLAAFTVLLAGPVGDARPTACGLASFQSYAIRTCHFAATGTKAYVQAAGASPIAVTYSLLTPVFPGAASVHATLRMPNGTVIAECEFAFLVAAACRKESKAPVPRGTWLTCQFEGATWGVGVLDWLCSSRNPTNHQI
jgi:hypothetical protein